MKGYKPDGFIENLFNEAYKNMMGEVEPLMHQWYKGQVAILNRILDPDHFGTCKNEHSSTMRMHDNYCVDCGIDIPDMITEPKLLPKSNDDYDHTSYDMRTF